MVIFRGKGRRGGEIFGGIVKYIMDHSRSTLKDVAVFLKEEHKLEVSVKTIERELEEYASLTCTNWSGIRKIDH